MRCLVTDGESLHPTKEQRRRGDAASLKDPVEGGAVRETARWDSGRVVTEEVRTRALNPFTWRDSGSTSRRGDFSSDQVQASTGQVQMNEC